MFLRRGSFSPIFLLTFIAPICVCLRSFATFKILEHEFNGHPFILTFLMFLGEFIGGCLQIVLYCTQRYFKSIHHHMKGINPTTLEKFTQVDLKPANIWTYKQYLYILALSLIDLLAMTLHNIVCFHLEQLDNLEFQMKAFQMVFAGLFTLVILHYPIFRHHVLSMVLIVVGMLLITFDTFLSLNYRRVVLKMGLLLISYSLWALLEASHKYLMEFKFVSPFQILRYGGAFGMMLTTAIVFALNYIACPKAFTFCQTEKNIANFTKIIQVINSYPILILYLSLFCLFSVIYNLFVLFIGKKYTPTHSSVSNTIASFLWECILYSLGLMRFDYYKIIHLIGYTLMIIATLLYNEIVICYLCKFEVNTKKEIDKRALEDDMIYKLIDEEFGELPTKLV